jgi:hypothetical protein
MGRVFFIIGAAAGVDEGGREIGPDDGLFDFAEVVAEHPGAGEKAGPAALPLNAEQVEILRKDAGGMQNASGGAEHVVLELIGHERQGQR